MTDWVVPIIVALIAAGLGGWVRDLIKGYRAKKAASAPDAVKNAQVHQAVALADESMLVGARARKELVEDNARLREENQTMRENHAKEIAAERAQHAADRMEWRGERQELREEIDALESRLRFALGEVQALKQRHGMTEPN